ncbi:MAG: hypothetical protein ACT4OT_01875 [Acidobacteriota bacterium]
MKDYSFANLISGKPIKWERPFFFFAALFVGDLVWMELGPEVHWSAQTGLHFSLFEVYHPWGWVSVIIANIILTVLATAAFRLLPNSVVALVVLVVLYPFLNVATRNIVDLIVLGSGWRLELTSIVHSLVNSFGYALCFVGALMLALRLIKNLLVALLAGSIVGTVLSHFVYLITGQITDLFSSSVTTSPGSGILSSVINLIVGSLPFGILSAVLFALVFWAALWLSGSLASDAEAPKPRLRRPFYAGIWAVTAGIAWFLFANTALLLMLGRWELSQRSSRAATFGTETVGVFLIFGFASVLALIASVLFVIVIYRMWAAIQDGHARTDPGRAVGFLFIPFFNIYWAFQALWGFAKDYNSYLDRHGLDLRRLPEGIFVAYIILCLGAFIPFVGWLLVAANMVVGTIMIAKICDAVNALPDGGDSPAASEAAAA